MTKISVITTFYNGNKYISRLVEMINNNAKWGKKQNVELEFVIVNDSPWIDVELNESDVKEFSYKLIKNDINRGIHFSRVVGVNGCDGEYLTFLDQDDEIADDYVVSQYNALKEANVVICNGIKESNKQKKIYGDRIKFSFINKVGFYLKAANQVVSPGQCLIRKKTIPQEWKRYILKTNGSDDLFLWLLLLSKGERFSKNNKLLYLHKQVGQNLSNDIEMMCKSDREMCELAVKYKLLPEKYISKRLRMCDFLQNNDYENKIKNVKSLKYLDIVIAKVIAYYI